LVLGFGFMWSDIICYAIGVVLAFLLISFIERNDN
jgi:tetrahydromethanopterin S-methyltransferase subunit F